MMQVQSKAGSEPINTSDRIVVVLPVHNEAGTIAHTIIEANNQFSKIYSNIGYLVAEDGSTDGTPQVLSHLQDIMPRLHVNSSTKRKGYPTAVRDGILSVGNDADHILFMDSDGQYDPRDFQKLVTLADNADIVIGRRTSRQESTLRVFLSTGVRLLARQLFGLECRDITSAFRLMRRDVAQELASRVHYSRYNFWIEFTALSAVSRYRIVEVPVSYRNRQSGGSRVYNSRILVKVILNELSALART